MEPDGSPATTARFDEDAVRDAGKRITLAQWHLEEVDDALARDHPDAAELAAELAEEIEALGKVVDAIDDPADRWASQEVVQR